MRSQKWRIVSLKGSKLRRFRSSLRVILKEAVVSELERLGRLKDFYRYKRFITHSQRKREIMLVQESNNLMKAWSHSILSCSEGPSCISIKRNELRQDMATLGEDMVWNPLLKKWSCIHCYNTYYRTDFQKNNLRYILKQKREEEKVFDDWFSSNIEER